MILYDTEIVPDEGGSSGEDSLDLNETLQKLEESIARLNQNLENQAATEEVTEEVTEAVTEEVTEEPIPEEDLPVQKKDIQELKGSIDSVNEAINKSIEENLRIAEENSTEESTTDLVFLDETVDHHLYLTSEVENADINDLYTMVLSARNIMLLFFLIFLSLFLMKLVRSALERVMNR